MVHAQSHGLTRITVDPGAYYFLTEQYPGSFLELHEMHDLTFDLAGSTIYLKFAYSLGINLTRCRRVTLTNFPIDFIELPYTHVRVTSVDTATSRIQFETLPGWTNPTTFHGELWAIGFRNGNIVPGTTNVRVADPVAPVFSR